MSFREFLSFEGIKDIAPISLEDILSRHREIAAEIARGIKVIGLFAKYGEYGYYPFYKESPSGYYQRIIQKAISSWTANGSLRSEARESHLTR